MVSAAPAPLADPLVPVEQSKVRIPDSCFCMRLDCNQHPVRIVDGFATHAVASIRLSFACAPLRRAAIEAFSSSFI
jgi:hypothetical protein